MSSPQFKLLEVNVTFFNSEQMISWVMTKTLLNRSLGSWPLTTTIYSVPPRTQMSGCGKFEEILSKHPSCTQEGDTYEVTVTLTFGLQNAINSSFKIALKKVFLRYCVHMTRTDRPPKNITPWATAVIKTLKHCKNMKQWLLAGNNSITSIINHTQPRHPNLFDLL